MATEATQFDGKMCEEMIGMVGGQYTRCGKPAVMLVQHNGRDEGPYYFCGPCGNHNAGNRNGTVLAVLAGSEDMVPNTPWQKAVNHARVVTGEVMDVAGTALEPTEDEVFAVRAGNAIREMLHGASAFFRRATELEEQARKQLAEAKIMVRPTSKDEDEATLRFIKSTTETKNEAEQHWEPLTSTLAGFHKRSTAGRKRAVELATEANLIGNRLHNEWKEADARRRAQEAEDKRRQEEERARLERERELAEQEAAALAAEQNSPVLSKREDSFARMIVAGFESRGAAKMAGFPKPAEAAAKLLGMQKIKDAMQAIRTANAIREQAEAKRREPLEVREVETSKPEVGEVDGVNDRTTWSGEVLDEAKFVAAVISGKYGIPHDVLGIKQGMLTQYARSMKEKLNRWPGVRAKKKTSAV